MIIQLTNISPAMIMEVILLHNTIRHVIPWVLEVLELLRMTMPAFREYPFTVIPDNGYMNLDPVVTFIL